MRNATAVLVIDDNPDIVSLLQAMLQLEGYTVSTAVNGKQGLIEQRLRPADIVITDLFMPDSDGFETIASIQKEFPRTKIVVVSGDGQRGSGPYLKAAQMMAVSATLAKPFEVSKLLELMKDLSSTDTDEAPRS